MRDHSTNAVSLNKHHVGLVSSLTLGMCDCLPGMLNQRLDFCGNGNTDGGHHPGADTYIDLPAIQQSDICIEDIFNNTFCDLLRILTDHAWQDDQKHVIFVTSHAVIGAALLADRLCNDA